MPIVSHHPAGTPSWCDLSTTNPTAAQEFYGALFGWNFQSQGEEYGHYSICFKKGVSAAGMGPLPPGAPAPAWTLYLASTNADESAQRITEAGGTVLMPAMDVGPLGRMLVAMDSTGATFGIWEARVHLGAEIESEHGAMCWAEVTTRDGEQTAAFYGAITGLPVEQLPDMRYWVLRPAPGQMSSGILEMDEKWSGISPFWAVYFSVDNVDAAVEQVRELGGTVHQPPFDTPYGRIAMVADPQGASFALIQLPSAQRDE